MRYRTLGRTGWPVGEIGYGMWGLAGWTGSDDAESLDSLERAVELGCTFFDTAWGYGEGHSERLLGRLVRDASRRDADRRDQDPAQELHLALAAGVHARRLLPARPHPRVRREEPGEPRPAPDRPAPVPRLGRRLGRTTSAGSGRWTTSSDEGLIRAVGISVNRWEPDNVVETLRTGQVDAVQVIYNIFDQAPAGRALPALPRSWTSA